MTKLFINESGKESLFELFEDSPEVTVGRGAANVVQIADGHSSKMHFAFRHLRGRWKLVDLESKNGTRVNGAFKNAHWLTHGDAITVGAVVMRFDAGGAPSGPPPARAAVLPMEPAPLAAAPARPVAVRPLAPFLPPAVPSARPAVAPVVPPAAVPAARPLAPLVPVAAVPPVAPRAVAPVAAPALAPARPPTAPARPAAAAPARSASAARVPESGAARRRREEDDDGEGGGGRFHRPKQGLSGGVIVVLFVLGAGLLALILQMALSGSNENTKLRERVQPLREHGKLQEALAILQAGGVPDTPGWGAVQEEIAEIQGMLALQGTDTRDGEAMDWLTKNVSKRVAVPRFRPKDHVSPKEAAHLLRQFFSEYGDTSLARTVLNATQSSNATYFAYQQIMRENPDESRTEKSAWDETERAIVEAVNAQRLGQAYRRLTFALQLERVNLPAEGFAAFERRVELRREELKQAATKLLDDTLSEGRTWASRGEASVGRAKVTAVLNLVGWPDGDLKRRADDAMRTW